MHGRYAALLLGDGQLKGTAMNVYDPALFSTGAPCIPCCYAEGASCYYLFDVPYDNYTDAAAFIAAWNIVDCIVYFGFGSSDVYTSLSTSFDGTTLTAGGTNNPGGPSLGISVVAQFGFSALAGTVSIGFTITSDGAGPSCSATLYDSAGAFVATDGASGTSGTLTLTIPSDGIYSIVINGTDGLSPSYVTGAYTVTSTATYWVNPIALIWDDGGTPRLLEACPRMLLPPLTEDTLDWYADETEAAAVLASANVSNCVGYNEAASFQSFTATDGGTSLTLACDAINTDPSPQTMWGSVNGTAGATISIAYSDAGAATSPVYSAELYAYDGALLETFTSISDPNPFVTSALPYSGRYIIKVSGSALLAPTIHFIPAFVITSSGTLSVNPIQALYDVGLDCAARLDCT